MKEVAIKIEGVGKKYEIGTFKDGSLRGSLGSLFKTKVQKHEDFWALKNISFEVKRGEVVGLIGKNGAGKSTLLKILSKITKPSEGKIEINGRVASLLEVGTGFHPELTGRENIFLNGTILGMSRKEVKAKFEEIVAFSGVEKFIDTPVKHYSSGMYVRLAFSVAAHLDPEILIIDEVLAVGDAEFQKKCLGKMKDVASSGRTVLFVSHNMNAINSLCSKCVYIKDAKINMYGKSSDVISAYLNNSELNTYNVHFKEDELPGDDLVKITTIKTINTKKELINSLSINKMFGIEINYKILKNSDYKPIPNVHFHTARGEYAFVTAAASDNINNCSKGSYQSIVWIPENLLNIGYFNVDVAISSLSPVIVHCHLLSILSFELIEDVSLRINDYKQEIPGVIRPRLEWETIKIS